MTSKYTFETLMDMSDKDLEILSKKLNKVSHAKYILDQVRAMNDKKQFKLTHWDISDICKHLTIGTSIVVGCYFIGKGLSEFGNKEACK